MRPAIALEPTEYTFSIWISSDRNITLEASFFRVLFLKCYFRLVRVTYIRPRMQSWSPVHISPRLPMCPLGHMALIQSLPHLVDPSFNNFNHCEYFCRYLSACGITYSRTELPTWPTVVYTSMFTSASICILSSITSDSKFVLFIQICFWTQVKSD